MRAEREEDIIWRSPPPKELKEIDFWAIGVGYALEENKGRWGVVYHGNEAYIHYMALHRNNKHVWSEIVNIRGIDYVYSIYSIDDPSKG